MRPHNPLRYRPTNDKLSLALCMEHLIMSSSYTSWGICSIWCNLKKLCYWVRSSSPGWLWCWSSPFSSSTATDEKCNTNLSRVDNNRRRSPSPPLLAAIGSLRHSPSSVFLPSSFTTSLQSIKSFYLTEALGHENDDSPQMLSSRVRYHQICTVAGPTDRKKLDLATTESQVIPIARNDLCDLLQNDASSGAAAADEQKHYNHGEFSRRCDYDSATWEMYWRIVSARKARANTCGICMGSISDDDNASILRKNKATKVTTAVSIIGREKKAKKKSTMTKRQVFLHDVEEQQHLIQSCPSHLYVDRSAVDDSSEGGEETSLPQMVHNKCYYGAIQNISNDTKPSCPIHHKIFLRSEDIGNSTDDCMMFQLDM